MRDYYEILGVGRDVSPDEMKRAYRKLAMKYHPDKNPGDAEAEARFKEAAEAYEILSNPDKRARYDRFGHAGVRNGAGGGGAGFQDINDIFSAFSDIFGGSFDDFFGGGRGGRQRGPGRRGGGLRITLPLTLEEIAEGVEKKVKVRKHLRCEACEGAGAEGGTAGFTNCGTCGGVGAVRQVSRTVFGQFVSEQVCPTCQGDGRIIQNPCTACSGEGRVKGEETITIPVPAGVVEGNYLTMRGLGNAGQRGGPAGDLRIEIEEVPHAHFVREGVDLYHDLHISFPDAALGAEVEVPTLKGRARLQIDPGTQSGKILRMRERGLPELNSTRRGDQLVRIHVWVPKKLTEEERAIVEKFRLAPSFVPRPETVQTDRKSFFSRFKDVFTG